MLRYKIYGLLSCLTSFFILLCIYYNYHTLLPLVLIFPTNTKLMYMSLIFIIIVFIKPVLIHYLNKTLRNIRFFNKNKLFQNMSIGVTQFYLCIPIKILIIIEHFLRIIVAYCFFFDIFLCDDFSYFYKSIYLLIITLQFKLMWFIVKLYVLSNEKGLQKFELEKILIIENSLKKKNLLLNFVLSIIYLYGWLYIFVYNFCNGLKISYIVLIIILKLFVFILEMPFTLVIFLIFYIIWKKFF